MAKFAFFVQELRLECLLDLDCGPGVLGWSITIVVYLYTSYCLYVIAHKTSTPNAWFAWVPILELVLTLQIAKKPVWWAILFFIPFANLVVYVVVMIALCQARAKPAWLTFALLLPVVNLVALGYLAFSDARVAHSESF
jgi:hypothetical protein